YHGRTDHQTKIRGTRIELTETHQHLVAHPGVGTAYVTTRPDADGQAQLVAYLVGADDGPSDSELREFLGERLPAAMVPTAWVRVDELPVLPNGKVDAASLPQPVVTGRGHVPPRTPVERILAGIWSQVLGADQVGAEDDFFDLGGHSLLAVQVLSRVKAEFGVELPVADLLTGRPTVSRLAELVEQAQLATTSADELAELVKLLGQLPEDEVRERLAEFGEQR
ncbi:phosphopantetheine-binding protein, partial [Micromonospora sp. DT229]|uniref:phosphopantetheine-binding protein n=1 Tax=Micromonospora sp. DT229 TaxID=3393430 RepID=UPI003CF17E96